jgi:hypothetical protein
MAAVPSNPADADFDSVAAIDTTGRLSEVDDAILTEPAIRPRPPAGWPLLTTMGEAMLFSTGTVLGRSEGGKRELEPKSRKELSKPPPDWDKLSDTWWPAPNTVRGRWGDFVCTPHPRYQRAGQPGQEIVGSEHVRWPLRPSLCTAVREKRDPLRNCCTLGRPLSDHAALTCRWHPTRWTYLPEPRCH